MNIETHTGGLADTNAYLVECAAGFLAIDAPQDFAEFCRGKKILALVLTHGHWDHIWDAAAIAEEHACPVLYHADDLPLITNPDIMGRFGLPVKLKPVAAASHPVEGDILSFAPWSFEILHIPGHCPGSICLYEKNLGIVFGGDVLFAGAVGRWDLPNGDQALLLRGIREKLLTLPDATLIHPGHGPSTTVGQEKRTNPLLL
jgi:glyoxylase-like metal-dependent hydrolase (beta-lactamase superfamily II)